MLSAFLQWNVDNITVQVLNIENQFLWSLQ